MSHAAAGLQVMDRESEVHLLREQVDEYRATSEILRLNNQILQEELEQLSLQLNDFAADELKRRCHDDFK